SPIPADLVGRWGVVGGPQDGATLEFRRDGTLLANVNVKGFQGASRSRVRVQEKQLVITSRHPKTDETKTQTQIIQKLTRHELILKAENSEAYRLVRLP
ncbi:MAG: hypothetical protein ACFCD0_03880, partial [Gemmataceae bacterium]